MKHQTFIKFFSSFIFGTAIASLLFFLDFSWSLSMLMGWIGFGLLYLVQSIYTFIKTASHSISKRCIEEDVSSWVLFTLILVTCITALVSISIVMDQRESWKIPAFIGELSCILAVGLSWAIVHTAFTFRYAHLYYGEANRLYSKHANGLIFPEDEHPDYWDFAYFSFTIGMTFQVSDVVIKAKAIRRLVLLHSIISFLFNTVIIALTINEMVNLNHG